MARTKRYKISVVCEAIKKANGYVSDAADALGCDISTVYRYRQAHESVAKAFEEARERRTDIVEGKLDQLIKDGNPAATIFYLKTQAKDRGYVERQEITGKDGGDLNVIVKFEDMSDDDDD